MKSQKDWLHTLHVTWLEYMTVFVVWMPPWGVPSSVGCCSLLNTTLLFSHFLNTSLSICTLLRSRFIWLKQPLMSPSSVHCGEQSLLKHLWSVSIASAVLLNFLNPYEFASASLSVISSKAIRYILHGSVLHGWYSQRSCLAICFGYVDLPQREGLISSPFQ